MNPDGMSGAPGVELVCDDFDDGPLAVVGLAAAAQRLSHRALHRHQIRRHRTPCNSRLCAQPGKGSFSIAVQPNTLFAACLLDA